MTDDLDSEEIGFEPVLSSRTEARSERRTARPWSAKSGLRRRVAASAILMGALATMGGAYATFATSSGASDAGTSARDINAGRQLYANSCVTCHGANLQGIHNQGPSLVGVGSASVYFQVITGRMPAVRQGAYEPAKPAKFSEQQTEQLAAYVESIGGGPALPKSITRAGDAQIADGGVLFRLNCAQCHGATFRGAPLSAGKQVPSLYGATDKVIYAAMLSGPENMPVFSDNTITPAQKREIIAYVQTLKISKDPGGNGIDRIGPVSEAVVIWVAGVGALMISILWIGAKAR